MESLNKFHWNSVKKNKTKQTQKNKVGVVLGQNLDLIRSYVVKKVKKLVLSIGFSYILHVGIHFKARSCGCTNT